MYDYSGNYQPTVNLTGPKEEILGIIRRQDFNEMNLTISKGKLYITVPCKELDPSIEKFINDRQPIVVHKKA